MVKRIFNEQETELLGRVVAKRAPELTQSLTSLGNESLTPEQKEALQQAMLGEMYENGLDEHDEPR